MSRLDAVADPVRLRIVRHLADNPGASLDDLAAAAEVHLNTVRPHVTALEEAGAVERSSDEPSGRGRPRLSYRLARDWSPPTADFRGLAELLAVAVLRSDTSAHKLHALGREWGRYLGGRPGVRDPRADLPRVLEPLGFEATVEGQRVHMRSCPCRLVLPDRPELVCELATGVIEGALEGSGTSAGRRHHDPQRRHCTVELAA